MENINNLWIKRIYAKCSGCRRCEITCSLHHEGKIWPEASRVRIMTKLLPKELTHARELMDQAKLDEVFEIVENFEINKKTHNK